MNLNLVKFLGGSFGRAFTGFAFASSLHDTCPSSPFRLRNMRRFLGTYLTYNPSLAAPDGVVMAATHLEEREGLVYSRTVDSIFMHAEGESQSCHYESKAVCCGERIFVVEFEAQNSGSFMLTTLFSPHRYRKSYLFGMTSFLSSYPRRIPYTSRTVWKRLEAISISDQTLQECGEFPVSSSKIGAIIRKFLLDEKPRIPVTPPFDN